jgi:hypothetical protein
MRFKLTLLASMPYRSVGDGTVDDGTARVVTADVTIPSDGMEGIKPGLDGALDVILLRLREAGMSVVD